jgi:hypothetical protein
MSDDKAIICHTGPNNYKGTHANSFCSAVTVSGTTITEGTELNLGGGWDSKLADLIALRDGHGVVCFSKGHKSMCAGVRMNGMTIEKGKNVVKEDMRYATGVAVTNNMAITCYQHTLVNHDHVQCNRKQSTTISCSPWTVDTENNIVEGKKMSFPPGPYMHHMTGALVKLVENKALFCYQEGLGCTNTLKCTVLSATGTGASAELSKIPTITIADSMISSHVLYQRYPVLASITKKNGDSVDIVVCYTAEPNDANCEKFVYDKQTLTLLA